MVVKSKKGELKVRTITGKFRDTEVKEGRKRASVLVLKPDNRNISTAYVIKEIPVVNIRAFKSAAARDIQSRTGISKAAIKKLGL